jgi:hypothetical protein
MIKTGRWIMFKRSIIVFIFFVECCVRESCMYVRGKPWSILDYRNKWRWIINFTLRPIDYRGMKTHRSVLDEVNKRIIPPHLANRIMLIQPVQWQLPRSVCTSILVTNASILFDELANTWNGAGIRSASISSVSLVMLYTDVFTKP